MTSRDLIVIPALNEEAAIGGVIRELRRIEPECDILVVSDGSTDHTVDVAVAAGATVVALPYNLGVGTALRTGFRYAVRNDYSCVVQVDADGQHDAREIDALRAAIAGGANLAIGSRFLDDSSHYEVDRVRGVAMRVLRVMVSALMGRRFTDTSSGFRAFDRKMLEYFSYAYPREFLSDTVEALLLAGYRGFEVVEVPTRMRPRQAGTPTHQSARLAFHYVRLVVVLVMTMSFSARRRRKAAV